MNPYYDLTFIVITCEKEEQDCCKLSVYLVKVYLQHFQICLDQYQSALLFEALKMLL